MAQGMNPGLMPGARLDKQTVRYRQHEKCSMCDHFYPSGNCDLVAENISPDAVCDKWEIKSQTPYKDKDFFQSEFNKVNKE